MDKAKKAKNRMPDWAKNPEKYQYKKGTGKHRLIDNPKKSSGTSAGYYKARKKDAIKKVLTTEW